MELHRSTQNKATRFFRKPLYQPSPNAVPVIPFQDGKFKPDDYVKFSSGMGKAKKDNVLKGNGIPGPGQYKIKGFAEVLVEKAKEREEKREIKRREKEMRKKEDEKNYEKSNELIIRDKNISGKNMVMKLNEDYEDDSHEINANGTDDNLNANGTENDINGTDNNVNGTDNNVNGTDNNNENGTGNSEK